MLFDAGLRRDLLPDRVRRPGPDPGPSAGVQRGARRLRVPRPAPGARPSPRAPPFCSTSAPRSRSVRHIPAILRGEEIWMQFLSEPSGGSDVAGALTTAVRDGDEWMLNGSKVWTTGAWWSDWGLCLARTNWDVPKHRGLTRVHAADPPAGRRGPPHRDAQRLAGVLPGVPDRCAGPDTDRIGEVDDGWTVGDPLDVPRADAAQLAVRDRSGRRCPRRAIGAASVLRVARRRRAPRRPRVRDLVGEARMLELVGEALQHRIGEGMRTGCHVRPVRRHRPAVRRHGAARTNTIAFEIAGADGGAWTDDGWRVADCGIDFLMRQVAMHRRRDHGDGPQRHQRAGARHAPRADARPGRPVPRRPTRRPRDVPTGPPGLTAHSSG